MESLVFLTEKIYGRVNYGTCANVRKQNEWMCKEEYYILTESLSLLLLNGGLLIQNNIETW